MVVVNAIGCTEISFVVVADFVPAFNLSVMTIGDIKVWPATVVKSSEEDVTMGFVPSASDSVITSGDIKVSSTAVAVDSVVNVTVVGVVKSSEPEVVVLKVAGVLGAVVFVPAVDFVPGLKASVITAGDINFSPVAIAGDSEDNDIVGFVLSPNDSVMVTGDIEMSSISVIGDSEVNVTVIGVVIKSSESEVVVLNVAGVLGAGFVFVPVTKVFVMTAGDIEVSSVAVVGD